MQQIANALIRDEKGGILTVEKPKEGGKVLTIIPGGKIEEGESVKDALRRELREELGITDDMIESITTIGSVNGTTPTSKIESEVILLDIKLKAKNILFKTDAEIQNPKYLQKDKILELETTTELTRKVISYLVVN